LCYVRVLDPGQVIDVIRYWISEHSRRLPDCIPLYVLMWFFLVYKDGGRAWFLQGLTSFPQDSPNTYSSSFPRGYFSHLSTISGTLSDRLLTKPWTKHAAPKICRNSVFLNGFRPGLGTRVRECGTSAVFPHNAETSRNAEILAYAGRWPVREAASLRVCRSAAEVRGVRECLPLCRLQTSKVFDVLILIMYFVSNNIKRAH
jgi:hypothetical protein